MNKEVIYLEPEDDITDILTKLQQAEQKLVALVPPKKASILRSAVNMKLVARVAKECDKVAVIVTADPAIIKMAMMAKIPVAKTLQSRPIVPTEENVKDAESGEQIIDEDLEEDPKKAHKNDKNGKFAAKAPNSPSKTSSVESADTLDLNEETLQEGSKGPEKGKSKRKQPKNGENDSFFQKYRKWIFIGSGVAVVLIAVLVWAFVFAPAVKITVAISSTPNNFSENVRFTTDQNAQNLEENLLFAERITLENTYKTDIAATGKEDRGDRAEGRIAATYTFSGQECLNGCAFSLNAGGTITAKDSRNNELQYIIQETQTIEWTSTEVNPTCTGGTIRMTSTGITCTLSVSAPIKAAASGTDYNINAGSRWNAYDGASLANVNAISGGTTNMVRIISDEDVDKVKEAQLAEHTLEGREDIMADLGKDVIPIEASFKGEVTEVKTSPDRSEEIADDAKPTAEVKVVYSIYVVNKNTIDEYIKLKTEVAPDQKIYSTGEPYFERFTDIENEARLKSTVDTGPTVTENDIIDKVKGKKTGQVASILRSINGVSSVNIETSFFWVWSVPNDTSKITVVLTGEDGA